MPTSSQQHDMPYYRHFLYPKNREKSAGFWLSVQKRPVSRADEGIRPYDSLECFHIENNFYTVFYFLFSHMVLLLLSGARAFCAFAARSY